MSSGEVGRRHHKRPGGTCTTLALDCGEWHKNLEAYTQQYVISSQFAVVDLIEAYDLTFWEFILKKKYNLNDITINSVFKIIFKYYARKLHQLSGQKLDSCTMNTRATVITSTHYSEYSDQNQFKNVKFQNWSYRESNTGPSHSTPTMKTIGPPRSSKAIVHDI